MPTAFKPPNPGINLNDEGVPQQFSYYADVFYGKDYDIDLQSYYDKVTDKEIAAESLDKVEPDLQEPNPTTPREHAFLVNFEAKLKANAALVTPGSEDAPILDKKGLDIATWLPDPVKQAIIKKAAMEAFYFLFNKEYVRSDGARFMVREELRSRLLKELAAVQSKAEKLVIVSHSMGTMVAYDVLRNCPECPPVDTLFTLGSPLGIREVQEELIAADADDVDFPAAKLGSWINIYDPLDPICGADPQLGNDYNQIDGKGINDIKESNWGKWRHTVTHYLAGTQMRDRLRSAVGIE